MSNRQPTVHNRICTLKIFKPIVHEKAFKKSIINNNYLVSEREKKNLLKKPNFRAAFDLFKELMI